jgi:A/G-specific adenine glycosylase
VSSLCAWFAAGRPAATTARLVQRYEGTDRQARGRLLAVLRDRPGPVAAAELDLAWPDERQRARALDGLVADGLVEPLDNGRYRLPA